MSYGLLYWMGMEDRKMKKPYRVKKGILYFTDITEADKVRNNLFAEGFEGVRMVQYALGFAIQREKSGPYWGYPKEFGVCGWL